MLKSLLSFISKKQDSEFVIIPSHEQEEIVGEGVKTFGIKNNLDIFRDRVKLLLRAPTILPSDSVLMELEELFGTDKVDLYKRIINKRTKVRIIQTDIVKVINQTVEEQHKTMREEIANEIQLVNQLVRQEKQAVATIQKFYRNITNSVKQNSDIASIIELFNHHTKHSRIGGKINGLTFEFGLIRFQLVFENSKWQMHGTLKKGIEYNYMYDIDNKPDTFGLSIKVKDGIAQIPDITTIPKGKWRGLVRPTVGSLDIYIVLKYGTEEVTKKRNTFLSKGCEEFRLQQYKNHKYNKEVERRIHDMYHQAQENYSAYIMYKIALKHLGIKSFVELAELQYHDSEDKVIPTIINSLTKFLQKHILQ